MPRAGFPEADAEGVGKQDRVGGDPRCRTAEGGLRLIQQGSSVHVKVRKLGFCSPTAPIVGEGPLLRNQSPSTFRPLRVRGGHSGPVA